MDDISRTNRERWNDLARANVQYSRPYLDFTTEQAEEYVYRHGVIQNVRGKRVLCLASGGGQDSAAFGLLGAEVTVLDLSDVQLERDRQAAEYHGLQVTTLHGDMRDLSACADATFDIVWQVYSINFVPSVKPVFREVARVLKPDGSSVRLTSPHEFRHTLSTVLNTLVSCGFILLGLWEWMRSDKDPEPGSWEHFTQIAPPYLSTFWRKR